MSKDNALKTLSDLKAQLQANSGSTDAPNVLEQFTRDGVLWFPPRLLSL
jgi:hypothetical protein